MEILAPPLGCVLEVKFAIESGVSVRGAIHQYLSGAEGVMATEVQKMMVDEAKGPNHFATPDELSPQRQALLEMLWRGLKGEPILTRLRELEKEFIELSKDEVEEHLRRLPFLALIPLMFFQLPAFLLLLVGPLTLELIESLAR